MEGWAVVQGLYNVLRKTELTNLFPYVSKKDRVANIFRYFFGVLLMQSPPPVSMRGILQVIQGPLHAPKFRPWSRKSKKFKVMHTGWTS